MDFRRFLHMGILIFAVGIVGIVMFEGAHVPAQAALNKMDWLEQFYYSHHAGLVQLSQGLAVAGFLWFVIDEAVKGSLSGTIKEGFETLSESINQGIVGMRRGKIAAAYIETLKPEEAKKLVTPLLKCIYGEHIDYSGIDLAKFIESKYHKYMDSRCLYKEGQKRTVKVESDGNGGYIWYEHLSYHLKYPAKSISGDAQAIKFILPYTAVTEVPSGMSTADFLATFVLRISVDGNVVFDISQCIENGEVKPACKGELSVERRNNDVSIKLKKAVDINKDSTEIKVDERSPFNIDDKIFNLITYEPIHNMTLQMSFPKGWVVHTPTISCAKLTGGDPSTKKRMWSYWPDEESTNQLSVEISDWIMPGIVLHCTWTPNL